MTKNHIVMVQTFARVYFADGTVAGIMAPSGEIGLAPVEAQKGVALRLLTSQSQNILHHFTKTSVDELHEAVINSVVDPSDHVGPRRVTKPEENA